MATLKSVIEYVDEIKPNAFSNEAKTQWVNECEGLVQTEVLLVADTELISYSYDTDKDKELLVKHPHVKIYWAYLTAMIDFANGEYNKYQNTMQMFNAFFGEYMRWFALWYHPADTHGENDGEDGWRGYYISAYGLAVKHGFEGTESEWVESLYGEEVMLRYDGTADELQWKYKSAEQWDSLMDTEALRGEIVSQTLSAAQSAKERAESAQSAAESAAQRAGTSAQSASGSASSASASAERANTDAVLASELVVAASDSENASAQSAQTATEKAAAAQAAAQAAESAKSAAAGSAQSAGTSAQSAQTSSKLSESWAVGGTGTRTGEDTNNARYWSEQAQNAAGGGVSSFNGRSGAVAPQTGDYTAAMVGADAQGAAQTVQGNLNTHAENTVMHITAAERTSWNGKADAEDLTSHVDNMAVHVTATEKTAWNGKQNALTFDTTPTEGSTNPITSGAVKEALDDVQSSLVLDDTPTANSSNLVKSGGVKSALDLKQDKSTAITTSNIASQTVNKAKYATDGVAIGTPALRNQYFASAEATPTVNGQICWVYG